MPLLFSYGTLQEENVQRLTFGRCCRGKGTSFSGSSRRQ